MRVPSSVPGGTVTMMRFSIETSPEPRQVGQRSLGTFPLPRHTGHGRVTANPPCPNEIVPRPLHSGQVEILAPGAAPLPLQVGQISAIGRTMGILPPRAAMRNGMESTVSTASSASSLPPRLPKMELNRSPRPPKDPRSEMSMSGPRSCGDPPAPPPPQPLRERAPPPAPPPANAPYLRSMSYFLRLSASLRTSCASLISLKRSAAWVLLGLRSGWYCLASRRNAFLISSVVAASDTPRTL